MILKHRGPPDKILSRLKYSVFLNCCDRRTVFSLQKISLTGQSYYLPLAEVTLQEKKQHKYVTCNFYLVFFKISNGLKRLLLAEKKYFSNNMFVMERKQLWYFIEKRLGPWFYRTAKFVFTK